MNNLTVFLMDLSETYTGLMGVQFFQEKSLEKNIVSQSKIRIRRIMQLKNYEWLRLHAWTSMYLNHIILSFRHHHTVFLLFQFFSGRYTILKNNVKNNVFQTMQQYYLVPIVRKEFHKKFHNSSKEVKQSKYFCDY